jgi:pimeloyl-ACP methyl ester carboxylesterase
LDDPDCLDTLVLAAPTLATAVDDPQARARYLLLRSVYRELGPGNELADLWMGDPPAIFTGLRAHPEAYAAVRSVVARHPFTELATGAMRMLTMGDQGSRHLGALRPSTLVLVGDQDMPRFTDNAQRVAAEAPAARVVTVPDAGHLPLIERPGWCRGVLRDFILATAVAAGPST